MRLQFNLLLGILGFINLASSLPKTESALEWQEVASGRLLLETKQLLPPVTLSQPGGYVRTGLSDLDALLLQMEAISLTQLVPRNVPTLYLVQFNPNYPVQEAVLALREWSGAVYAEPDVLRRLHNLAYTPNDFLLPGQWHIDQIQSRVAWSIYRGADTVQVGIIDSGVDYDHPDLAPNIWVNPGEDLNGDRIIQPAEWDSLDNDVNGYIDDFWGWDWVNVYPGQAWPGEDYGTPDNDPSDFSGHGTHCAGDASAATDNGLGVAGPGFNTQIMTLRAGWLDNEGQGSLYTTFTVPGIYYALNMGAEVISMSYGGPYDQSEEQALQAAYDAGLILIASAGNSASPIAPYPAAYNTVIAVAATAPGDVLAGFTNFGHWIDVCAPGVGIFSTIINAYGNMDGTSMAAPITAGVAALVKSLKPEWNSTQVSQWLALTADNIDLQNPTYIGLMGGGRLNAAHAVDLFVSIDSLWTDNLQGGSRLTFGQAGHLFVRYHKYSGTAENVILTLNSSDPRVSFTQAVHNVGTLVEGQSGDNSGNPFVLTVQSGGEDYETIPLAAHFSGTGFEFTQPLEIVVGRGQILIIDADQGESQQTNLYYEEALTALGYTWETWQRDERLELGTEIATYDAVIHFSGTAQTNIFPGNDWEDLDDYLDAGGNLILTGQNVAQDLAVSQPSVLLNILRVQFLNATGGTSEIHGAPTNPLTQGMDLIIAGPGGAWNQNSPDKIGALLGAEPWFVYNLQTPSELAGVRTRIGQSDVIYCAFGLEGISDSSSAFTRQDVLELMLNQFGLTPVTPREEWVLPLDLRLYQPYPNPFNSAQKITYHLPVAGALDLTVYDLSGRMVQQQVMENAPAGEGYWIWTAPPALSSGMYFISMKFGAKTLNHKTVYIK